MNKFLCLVALTLKSIGEEERGGGGGGVSMETIILVCNIEL